MAELVLKGVALLLMLVVEAVNGVVNLIDERRQIEEQRQIEEKRQIKEARQIDELDTTMAHFRQGVNPSFS